MALLSSSGLVYDPLVGSENRSMKVESFVPLISDCNQNLNARVGTISSQQVFVPVDLGFNNVVKVWDHLRSPVSYGELSTGGFEDVALVFYPKTLVPRATFYNSPAALLGGSENSTGTGSPARARQSQFELMC